MSDKTYAGLSRRLGPRKSRAGRRGNSFQTFTPDPKTQILDALQSLTGLSRRKLWGFSSCEFAPLESVNCFLLWWHWRRQRCADRAALSALTEKWKKRFYAIGVEPSHRRSLGRKSYRRNISERRSKARRKKNRLRATPEGAIQIALRQRLYQLVRSRAARKIQSAIDVVGCDITTLCSHLEKRFKPGMSWENYGQWHVDHKRPCATFNLLELSEQRACFHFTNLQPLWALENLTKGSKIV